MMTHPRLVAVSALALVLGAGALAQARSADPATGPNATPATSSTAASRNSCFFNRQVSNFTARDEKTLYLKAGREVYRLDMFGRCMDMDTALDLGLDSRPTSSICGAQDVTVLVHTSNLGPQRCAVRTLTRLSPAEVEALPKRDRP
jgi:hypothetical protein